jgi:hypothetical protein
MEQIVRKKINHREIERVEERGKRKSVKNKCKSQRTHHKSNPGGYEEVRASIPAAIFGSYTNSPICGPLLQETLRGWGNYGGKEERKK